MSLTRSYFGPCHIFSVVLTAILSILFILSAVSTFIFKSSAIMHISALTKCFLLVTSPINLSESSCRRLVKFSRKSKMSVESALFPSPILGCPLSLYESLRRYVWCRHLCCRLLFVLIQRDCCLMPLKYPLSFLVLFRVFFSRRTFSFDLSTYCVSVLKDIKILLKVSKSEF